MQRAPTVFCIPEEAHIELIKLREFLRVMSRLVEPGTTASEHDFILRPHALSWLITQLWTELGKIVQTTYWSEDHTEDLEEAHRRIAEMRERNAELRGHIE
ncbi:hypothetical protein LVB87_00775 [Lysobacter sp. KIS68-7]|uniref:XAC0095 family protein n=1 Tax=Lysobacter sp. KIS68-7 TaxID=2904252 RepID=UPI001E5576B0|nr:hypothetical protein [Lysobacter sp. KIS68-7]UHQ19737.1 hypothetical protein LVB87_00775 [Lysobacter sp. KIS68-7]